MRHEASQVKFTNKMREGRSLDSPSGGEATCFLCLEVSSEKCPHCGQVYFCSPEHYARHRHRDYCLPYTAGRLPGKGRVLFATRDIKPLELILVDPGTVVGPNYKSEPVCLQCLRPVSGAYRHCLAVYHVQTVSGSSPLMFPL